MLARYALADVYEALRRAAAVGDAVEAQRLIGEALGLQLDGPAQLAPAERTTTRLRYRGFKPAELAMLAADLKPVVKFEDIPVTAARRFVDAHAAHYRLTVTPPYVKDRLLLRTRRAGGGRPLVTIYASRGDEGDRLRAIETRDREAIAESGALLGFPPCCVAAFDDLATRARTDQDTVNDDAVRALLAATAGLPGDRRLDPLHDLDLLAFYPCSPRCEAAIAFADRTSGALRQASPEAWARADRELGAPVLFWRTPFYVVFAGTVTPDGAELRYTDAKVHVFPDAAVAPIQRLFGGAVLAALDRGDRLRVEGPDVIVAQGAHQVAHIPGSAALPPLLGWWQGSFFDPPSADRTPTTG